MSLTPLLEEVRALYVSQFLASVAEAGAEPDVALVTEGDMADADGELVTDGALDVGCRMDIVVVAGTEARSIRVDSTRTASFAPSEFEWEKSLAVRLRPFQWDYCEVNVSPAIEATAESPVADWFRRWFEPHEAEARTLGVAHFVSDPEKNGEYQRYYVDFGTAPVRAFEELLDAFLLGGAKEVVIGSGSTSDRSAHLERRSV